MILSTAFYQKMRDKVRADTMDGAGCVLVVALWAGRATEQERARTMASSRISLYSVMARRLLALLLARRSSSRLKVQSRCWDSTGFKLFA